MKKLPILLSFSLLALSFSCTDDQDPSVTDLDAPVIGFAEGRDSFRPMANEVRAATTDHMHIRFSVTDESGIGQVLVDIHNTFDGHTHGRLSNTFEKLSVKDIYSANAENPIFRFPVGAKTLNVDNSSTDIYWAGPTSRVEGNVLAGPYDIIISAVDIHGNQTGFADESNYITTFFIERAYAPVTEVTNLHDGEIEGEAGEALAVEGSISKGNHELSSEIKFVWIRLVEEDDHQGHNHGRIKDGEFYEKMWGKSTWRQGLEGEDLPNNTSLNLSEILSGENAIILPAGEDHLELIIWVEDVQGNVTQKTYEVHID
ncbi:DUF4625 domain-containing protein [Belliella sp. R4-6]|uniref:DUF4625 domain-containing protein n=1 Tax=Belliella alkalica TaxID=1730871 RepID=A0ABS9V6Y6_9BACT|nr:DUF4625 domain-containing protein [Belliella alkalica]MCH7412182.1 DUF4625 domain-containing protein [Belliella alkalica]